MDNKSKKISLFFCSNKLNSNELLKAVDSTKEFTFKPVSLACSGRINIQYLLKSIERGADGVILLTCPNETCNFIEGNLRAEKRAMAVNSLLRESGFESDRIKTIQLDIDDTIDQINNKIIAASNTIINIPQERNITV